MTDRLNLAGLVAGHACNQPSHPAIVGRGREDEALDYREAWHRIEACAARLAAAGVATGDRVGLALGDHPIHLLLHYAAARLGAVILPVDHRWTVAEQLEVAHAFDARCVLTDQTDARYGDFPVLQPDEAWYQSPRAALPPMPEDGDLPVLVSLSSGTTGRPKGALVTHRQLYERFVAQWVTLGIDGGDRFVALTPLYFGAGRSFGMCLLAAGGTVVLDPPPHKPEELVAAINGSRATAAFLVPTLLRRLLPLAGGEAPLLPHLKLLISSGAVLHAAEAREISAKLTPRLLSYYASSEGGGISALQPREVADHADTVGRPVFRVEVEILDGEGRPVAVGETGRLRYRGPGVATRFLDEDGTEHEADEGGWFCPGDLACRGPDGHLTLRGREKDVIIRGGANLYPGEIENALLAHPEITEAAVVARPCAQLGEEPVAFVCGAGTDEQAVLAWCSARLAPYKVPAAVIFVDELPKSSLGKILKKDLAERLQSH
ncbi:MAG TPA: class I adenylate-forming enzyme family protein [Woeseiaceae bacterium]|nr:class I adenylate-forming enzyme family protein [Woeseiaceae bacterium]